jgi:hypothetical protein
MVLYACPEIYSYIPFKIHSTFRNPVLLSPLREIFVQNFEF